MPTSKVIIDTDPGVDDTNAMLLALAVDPEDIEVLMISVTYGNVDVQDCLRNVVSMFSVIQQEIEWRKTQGLPPGFKSLEKSQPLVAVGADGPLGDQQRMADYFHGIDGLGGIYQTHPHLTPKEAWAHLFDPQAREDVITTTAKSMTQEILAKPHLFIPCSRPSHIEIIRLLESNPPQTITIIALGPLTNLALAASHAPAMLSRAKEIVVMGGAINKPGNITPLAEFNFYADSIAAARVLALTSPFPDSTMPPFIPSHATAQAPTKPRLPPYPSAKDLGPSRLNLILLPLDLTEGLPIRRRTFTNVTDPLRAIGSPLAEWTAAFMESTFRKMEKLHTGHEGETTSLVLHDPLCVWWAMDGHRRIVPDLSNQETRDLGQGWVLSAPMDLRVETTGQWSRGACVVDKRDRRMENESERESELLRERIGDVGAWLSIRRGNRVRVCLRTPGRDVWPEVLLGTIFGRT